MLWGISGTSLAIVCPPDPCWANDRRYQLQSGKVMQACRNLTTHGYVVTGACCKSHSSIHREKTSYVTGTNIKCTLGEVPKPSWPGVVLDPSWTKPRRP